MNLYRADLHIHTVLSPCGDLEMSPVNIVKFAKEQRLDIIGITDHNSTKHCKLTRELASRNNIFVLCGTEVTSKEEVHCLTYFETDEQLDAFQLFLDQKLPEISNENNRFGYQVIVDENENIIEEENRLLISAIDASMDQIEQKTHELGGLFIPAHIDRPKFSIISQLGFVPFDLNADAFEISAKTNLDTFLQKNKYLKDKSFIKSSDSHYIEHIGQTHSHFFMNEISFQEIKQALLRLNGRFVKT